MRICLLTHGGNLFGRHYARAFGERGHDVCAISLTPQDVEGSDVPTRIIAPAGFDPLATRSRTPYARAVLPVRRAVRDLEPDILFALYLSSAGVVACLSGHRHVVVSARGGDVSTHIDRRIWRAVFRWQGRRADRIHCVSESLAEALRDRAGVREARLIVCPLGVDTGHLPLIDPAVRPHRGRIVCTRSHTAVYDQATLIRAIKHLAERGVECHLTFANSRRVKPTRALVAQHGVADRVTFLPGYRPEELPGLLADADVYVSTSLRDGTSSSLLEALSTGTFPVVSDIAANRPWVEHGRNGLLFPPGDAEALADRIAEALSRADLRTAAAPISRKIVLEKGDLYKGADMLLDAFRQCLRAK